MWMLYTTKDILLQEFIAYNFHFVIYFMRLYIYFALFCLFIFPFSLWTDILWRKMGHWLWVAHFYAVSFTCSLWQNEQNANGKKILKWKKKIIIHILNQWSKEMRKNGIKKWNSTLHQIICPVHLMHIRILKRERKNDSFGFQMGKSIHSASFD